MTRVVRNAALFCVAGILVASAALANVPDPAHSTLQGGHHGLEGHQATATPACTTPPCPDICSDGRCADWSLTVRDFANNVISGSQVIIDYSACTDLRISCDQLNAVTGQTGLAGSKIQGTTNSLGQFTFKAQGSANVGSILAGNVTQPGTNAGINCAVVYADGVPLGNLIVHAYDQGGGNGVVGADASVVLADVGKVINGGVARARDDFNSATGCIPPTPGVPNTGTCLVNGADASIMLAMVAQQVNGTGSRTVPTPYCP